MSSQSVNYENGFDAEIDALTALLTVASPMSTSFNTDFVATITAISVLFKYAVYETIYRNVPSNVVLPRDIPIPTIQPTDLIILGQNILSYANSLLVNAQQLVVVPSIYPTIDVAYVASAQQNVVCAQKLLNDIIELEKTKKLITFFVDKLNALYTNPNSKKKYNEFKDLFSCLINVNIYLNNESNPPIPGLFWTTIGSNIDRFVLMDVFKNFISTQNKDSIVINPFSVTAPYTDISYITNNNTYGFQITLNTDSKGKINTITLAQYPSSIF
jgi:hypothetical protein